MKNIMLGEEQILSIASFLRSAGAHFREFAIQANDAGHGGLKECFVFQARQAEQFADTFENAEHVEITPFPEEK